MRAWGISINFGVGCIFMGASVIAAFDLIWRTIRIPRFGRELKVLLSLACIVGGGMILTKGYRNTHRIEAPVVLGTPLLRIEPERDILASSNGEFVLRLVNYGVDVDHVLIDQDYFVAQKFGDDIRIKLILNIGGATSPIVLRTNQSLPINVGFGRADAKENELNIQSAYKLAVHTNPVPSILGVRITATFRRFTDQKEFHKVGAFQAERSDSGLGLMSLFGPLAYETMGNMKATSEGAAARPTLNEVMPYIESKEHWSAFSFKYENGKWVSAQ
jgi:hypothetical protein